MKIRPKTIKLLKELLLEKGGVFYQGGSVINFKYNGESFYDNYSDFEICLNKVGMDKWLKYDDWYIKV